MKSINQESSENYLLKIDFKNNKKQSGIVTFISLLVLIMLVTIRSYFDPGRDSAVLKHAWESTSFGNLLCFLITYYAMILSHESIHGVFMKLFGGHDFRFGMTFKYAYVGCDSTFPKYQYIAIALAPLFILSMILIPIILFVHADWKWLVYLMFSFSVAGSAGDVFVSIKVFILPRECFIRDYGLSMVAFMK